MLTLCSVFYVNNEENKQKYYYFDKNISRGILENKAVLAINTSSNEGKIGEAWIIAGIEKLTNYTMRNREIAHED